VLGDAVWEGYPGAALRVLLPMTLAFNVLLPRGGKWRAWLVLGNLAVFCSSDVLKPPGRESFRVEGPRELRIVEATGRTVEAIFSDEQWLQVERSRFHYWRWSRGDAAVVFRNPQSFPVVVDIVFDLKSNDVRKVSVREDKNGGALLWSGETVQTLRRVFLGDIRLPPGDTVWKFDSDKPAEFPPNPGPHRVAFSLRNLRIEMKAKAAERAGK
jgi:hypothetical protein